MESKYKGEIRIGNFQRYLDKLLEDKLQSESLFLNKLKADCQSGIVFPSVRGGYMSFYYGGSSLFKYAADGFSTHTKYAFVPKGRDNLYVTQETLGSIALETNFADGYDKIKERCALYTGVEAEGVSSLYKYSAVCEKPSARYYLVDIEIAFEAKETDPDNEAERQRTIDRIDILLYDNEDKQLLFCEAKHFSNGEVWAKANCTPKVTRQIDRYNQQIKKREKQILEEYAKHFSVINNLFGTNLNPPQKIYEHCGLLLFGFDRNQQHKIKQLLIDDNSLDNCNLYPIGNIKGIEAKKLYMALTKK